MVILGIVGLILPVMPGWIFLIPGLLILADYFPPIRRLVDYIKKRFHDAESAYLKSKRGKSESSSEDPSSQGEPPTNGPDASTAASPERSLPCE